MARRTKKPDRKMRAWIDARKRNHLSHAQVQMAREPGLNPAKLGHLDNHRREPWKLALPQFIEELYLKRFGRTAPDAVISIEERGPWQHGSPTGWRVRAGLGPGVTRASPACAGPSSSTRKGCC